MTGLPPYQACHDQLKSGQHGSPHPDRRNVDKRPVRDTLFGCRGVAKLSEHRVRLGHPAHPGNSEFVTSRRLASTEKK